MNAERPVAAWQTPGGAADPAFDQALLSAFKWRSIGPLRGGRSIAVSGVKGRPREGYFGAVGGGLWKTTNGGSSWTPVTDGQIKSSSVGAVAVSESNPDIVFIGMGESCIRGNILPGDGVYKSADSGKSWTHVGFDHSDAISKIRIHPTNSNIVFVADFGRYGTSSDERGVFKSSDGGRNWKRVLFRDSKTGGVDVEIDRRNPNVMFVALWEAYRIEYQMSSGGPGSGLFKSTDGGETWREITRAPGLPQGPVGKISVAISGADSSRVYALIENENGGLFSSDDAGATWKLVNAGRNIRQRAFYYTHVFADPGNKDTVYVLNTSAFRSTDGGKTLRNIGNGTHGDHHDLWVDPDDANHVIIGNDGGGAITYDVASSQRRWTSQDFPTGQFYHVITTKHVPYHVCGAQQDNSTLCVSSATILGGGRTGGGGGRGNVVPPYDAGGGEPGYIAPDPMNPDVFYSGANNGSFLTRLDRRTGGLKEVGAYPRFFSGEPSIAVKERWQWTYPIIFSPADPAILYTASQHVWKTTNGGMSWERISGDLTRHDPKTQQASGGPITHDMNSPEIYGTVFSIGPGKTDANVIWAGSDDGLVHVTRDAGKNWMNVTPPDMPDFGRVSQIDASTFDAGSAYVSVKKPLLADFSPYIFRTHDFGRTWTKIVSGIAPNDYISSVREDPFRRGLLYAGAQHGFYVSLDDGDHWRPLSLDLPDTQVSDIWVEGNDVAIATHGRGFYILDDVAPLRQYSAKPTSTSDAHLFKPGDTVRGGTPARIAYWLKRPAQSLTLEIVDGRGQVVRSFTGALPKTGGPSEGAQPAEAGTDEDEGGGRGRGAPPPSMAAGLQRFAWDLQAHPVVRFPGMVLWGATENGPTVLPGAYQARLTVDGRVQAQSFAVTKHPWHGVGEAELQEQFELASQIRDKVNEANNTVIQIRRLKQQLADRVQKSQNADAKAIAEQFTKELTAVEENVYQVRSQSNQDPLNFPIKTNNRLASLLRVVETGEGRPTGNVVPIFADLKNELKEEVDQLQRVISTYLPRFNLLAEGSGIEKVTERNDYSDAKAWLCRPDIKGACDTDLTTTVIAADGKLTRETWRADPDAPIDCFYVYPTVSTDSTPTSDMNADAAELNVIRQQFARFASKCRPYAPLYRQVTIAGLRAMMSGGGRVTLNRGLGYEDVRDAWKYYLEHDNKGRGFVLIGHSQGSYVLIELIRQEIDGNPVQSRMVSAILLGATLAVARGKDVGGAFQHVPLCHTVSQTGCVITYASFRSTVPPPANTLFGKVEDPNLVAACTNPAALGGGSGELHAYLDATGRTITGAAKLRPWVVPEQPIETPWVSVPGLLTARCATNENATYLEVTVHGDPSDPRVDDITGDLGGTQILANWGLHLVDVNLALGNLVDIVGQQAKSYVARGSSK